MTREFFGNRIEERLRRAIRGRGGGVGKTDAAENETSTFYDNVANRLTADSAAGTFTSTYDPRNQLVSLAEPGGKIVSYVYDPADRRVSMNAYGKGVFTYAYDPANRQTLITTPSLLVTTIGYDPLARVIQRQHSSGVLTTQTWDPAGNVSGITNNGPSSLISQLGYAYNPANQRTVQAENDGTVTTWTYDRAYQIINEDRAGGPAGTSFNVTHTYDPAGNQTIQNDGTTITTYTYSPANKLTLARAGDVVTTYSNDAAGNRTAEVPSTGDSTLFAWDAPARMVSADVTAGIATFTYNTDGQRVAKQSTDGSVTGFLYDHKRLLQETDDVGGDVTKMYASSTTDEFGDLIGEDGEFTHVYDAQANTNALLDTSGQVEAAYKYDAFCAISAVSVEGGAWSPVDWPTLPPELSSNMLAGGKKQYYLDPETELYLLGSGNNGRYYDAGIGRFLSEDPIRQAGEDPNLFGYVKNDPINKLDPSGHNADDDAREKEKKAREAAEAAKQAQEAKDRDRQAKSTNSQPNPDANQGTIDPKNQAKPDQRAAAGDAAPPPRQPGLHKNRDYEAKDESLGMVYEDLLQNHGYRFSYHEFLRQVQNAMPGFDVDVAHYSGPVRWSVEPAAAKPNGAPIPAAIPNAGAAQPAPKPGAAVAPTPEQINEWRNEGHRGVEQAQDPQQNKGSGSSPSTASPEPWKPQRPDDLDPAKSYDHWDKRNEDETGVSSPKFVRIRNEVAASFRARFAAEPGATPKSVNKAMRRVTPAIDADAIGVIDRAQQAAGYLSSRSVEQIMAFAGREVRSDQLAGVAQNQNEAAIANGQLDPSKGLPGYANTLVQGQFNTVQALQNTVIGIVNMGAQATPITQVLNIAGVNTKVPSPDWAKNKAANEFGGHDVNVGVGEVAIGLATLKLPVPTLLTGGKAAAVAVDVTRTTNVIADPDRVATAEQAVAKAEHVVEPALAPDVTPPAPAAENAGAANPTPPRNDAPATSAAPGASLPAEPATPATPPSLEHPPAAEPPRPDPSEPAKSDPDESTLKSPKNEVFRALREGEDPTKGLRARSPGANTEVGSHVMGKKESDLISTTKDQSKAEGLFNSGNGVVGIDLDKVSAPVIDASQGIGKGRIFSRTKSHKEVLIRDTGRPDPPIPPEAIRTIQEGKK